ncbi:MAG: hypothetical protein KKF74_04035 [Nanoarchaeota archaeon]|nr:hypothetical protein [Nanoarchaeota archaeon]
MIYKKLTRNEKDLNRLNPNSQNMKRNVISSELKGDKLIKAMKEAQKDSRFIKEINKFIKATTSVHKLY